MAAELNLPEVLNELAERHQVSQVVLQGEIIGQGVQKNKYKIQGLELYCFSLLLDGQKHAAPEIKELLRNTGIKTVPVTAENFVIPSDIPELVKLAEGQSLVNPQTRR